MFSREHYWDERFKEGKIWGGSSCPSVEMSLPYLRDSKCNSILVPGCGYGRNSLELARNGFEVKGTDVSEEAIRQATNDISSEMKNITYQKDDVLNPSEVSHKYDAIYLSNVLHLFLHEERHVLLSRMNELLKQGGLLIFTCISTTDYKNYKVGEEIEHNTFLHNGKSLHFYDKVEIDNEILKNFKILEQKLHIQTEKDPSGNQENLVLWFVVGKKIA